MSKIGIDKNSNVPTGTVGQSNNAGRTASFSNKDINVARLTPAQLRNTALTNASPTLKMMLATNQFSNLT